MAAFRSYAVLFALLVVTGFVLMFYYTPMAVVGAPGVPPKITFGMVMRGAHFWASAVAMISSIWILTVAFFGKRTSGLFGVGRWGAVVLFLMTALLEASGLLLPWDQLALSLIARVAKSTGFSPTLFEFYTLHVIVLPAILAVVLVAYFRRISKGRLSASA